MAEIFLNVSSHWDGDLATELKALLRTEINPAVERANKAVGEAMRDVLVKHLEMDVYSPKAYKPTVYERRGENGGLLGQAREIRPYSDGTHVSVIYRPSGGHSIAKWHDVDGDELIGRIEKHNPEYRWLPHKGRIPNRPFWQNFVDEMIDGGGIEAAFQNEMLAALSKDWTFTMDTGVEREAQDGEYE